MSYLTHKWANLYFCISVSNKKKQNSLSLLTLEVITTRISGMSESCQANRKSLLNKQTISAEAQRASYEVAYLIAQVKKPDTIGETLNKPVAINRAMHGDKLARKLESVPLSNGTIARRITDMAQDITCQLVDRVKKGKYALQ